MAYILTNGWKPSMESGRKGRIMGCIATWLDLEYRKSADKNRRGRNGGGALIPEQLSVSPLEFEVSLE